jgi:HEAT repeat protein
MARLQNHWRSEPHVVATLQELGVTCADELVPLLHAEDESIALRASWALGRVGGKMHSLALLRVLQHDRPGLWMESATSLSLLESKRPVHELIRLTLDADRPVEQRYAAAYVLAFSSAVLNAPRYREPLCNTFTTIVTNRQEPANVRGLAAEGLGNMFSGCFGNRDQPDPAYHAVGLILTGVLKDPEPEVRFWAAFALSSLRYHPALPALRELANRDAGRFGGWWTVGEEAADAIDRIEGREPPDRTVRSE